jgi:hypothetical protein
MALSHTPTFALHEFAVQRRHDGWHYWPYGHKDRVKGPYSSEFSVCLMIARELRKELLKRNVPLQQTAAAA